MERSGRLFELIQILRAANGPLTGSELADQLEVTKRTIYRDIAALQARRVPIEGQAGIGYVMRSGYDLPPLNFTRDEREALAVGLSLIGRTGDGALLAAARRAGRKLNLPAEENALRASQWHDMAQGSVDPAVIRSAIAEACWLTLTYQREDGAESTRQVMPFRLTYYVEVSVLGAYCGLRNAIRHFRLDRITRAIPSSVAKREDYLRMDSLWQAAERERARQSDIA